MKGILEKVDIIVYIGGFYIFGKYLFVVFGSVEEVVRFFIQFKGEKIFGGFVFMGFVSMGGIKIISRELQFVYQVFDYVVYGDFEVFFFDYLSNLKDVDLFCFRIYVELRDYVIIGVEVVKQFFDYFDFVIVEIEI